MNEIQELNSEFPPELTIEGEKPVKFTKTEDDEIQINVDLRKGTRALAYFLLYVLIWINLFFVIGFYFEFLEIALNFLILIILIQVGIFIAGLFLLIQSRFAEDEYFIDKEQDRLVKTKNVLSKAFKNEYDFDQIRRIECRREPAQAGPLYRIRIRLKDGQKIPFFTTTERLYAFELSKELTDLLESECIYRYSDSTDDWIRTYHSDADLRQE